MICCLNPDCPKPHNPDGNKFCQNCSTPLVSLLRNRFRIVKLLSDEGGFGRTYLAEDADKLNERCVVKQLAPKVQGTKALQKARQLFEDEAKRLLELGEHPQIPTLLACFEQDNNLYLVQQFIDGQNLLDEIAQHKTYSESQIRELLLDLLPILKFIHQRRVIHRDIKPPNIMRRQSDGRLFLIDFGASKQLTATVQTKTGTQIGSFGYIPYEQMQDGEAYPASDLFGLGATSFHLLTGTDPSHLYVNDGYGWVANWRQYLKSPVSSEFDKVLSKLLHKDVEKRYQSAEEVIGDLTPEAPSPPIIIPPLSQTGNNFSLANTLNGHSSRVRSVAISPDGGTLVSGSDDETIKVWNLSTGQEIRTLRSFGSVYSVAISPDGGTLVSGGYYDTIKVWNLTTGREIRTLNGHSHHVYSFAISPDGGTLVSGSYDKTIKVWNLSTGQEIRTLRGHSKSVSYLTISPDGETLVSGSYHSTIKVWNLSTGEEIRTLYGHSYPVNSVAISPDGGTLVNGSYNSTIKVWNLSTGEEIRTLYGHSYPVNSVAISPDGGTLVSGSHDGTIKVWNLSTGQEIHTLRGHSSPVNSVAISPDGQTLVSGSDDSTIKIWRVES